MKFNIFSMSCVAPLALLSTGMISTSALAAPQIYGAIYINSDASFSRTKTSYTDGTPTEITSGRNRVLIFDDASRIGVRGSETLSDKVDLRYRIEWRNPFDVNTRTLEPRDAWIGLAHKDYGTFKAGRMLTYDAYLNDMPWGRPSYYDGLRTNNSLRYESPVVKGNQFTAQYIMDENTDSTTAGTDSLNGDGYALTLSRNTDKYSIGVAYVNAETDDKAERRGVGYIVQPLDEAWRVNASYQATPTVKLAAMYQQNSHNGTQYGEAAKTEKAFAIGASRTLDKSVELYSQVNVYKDFNEYGTRYDNKFDIIFGAKKDFSSTTYAGVEAFYYQKLADVPAHMDGEKAIKAHRIEDQTSGLSLYSGFHF